MDEEEINEMRRRMKIMEEYAALHAMVPPYAAPMFRPSNQSSQYHSPIDGLKSNVLNGEGAKHTYGYEGLLKGALNNSTLYKSIDAITKGMYGEGANSMPYNISPKSIMSSYGKGDTYSKGYTGVPSLAGKVGYSGGKAGYSAGGKGAAAASSGSSSGSGGK